MLAIHPENVATLLVVGGLVTLLLHHLLAWRHDPGRSHLPWVLISATGIAFGVIRIMHLSTLDPERALALTRAQYVVALFLPALAVATMETLAERPHSRATWILLALTVPVGAADVATSWFVTGPPLLHHDALGHPFWAGRPGPGLAALVPLVVWTARVLYQRAKGLPPELAATRRWLRLAVVAFVALGAHDIVMGAGVFRSIHLFEYGYLLFAIVATMFETHRTALLRAGLLAELEGKRLRLLAKEASLDQARAELTLTHQRLERADRLAALGTLAAGTAHEINNPLTFVVGNAELLAEEHDRFARGLPPGATDEARGLLRDIATGTARIRRVVEQLLVLARDEAVADGPLDVRAVAAVSLAMASHHLRHRARVVRDLRTVPPVFGNEARLGQVLLNLIVNAAQAIPDGGADHHEVRVATRVRAGRVVLEVTDTGVGMTPDVRARIFDPFFTTKQVGQGTGLGLSISMGIVTSMGGTIDVDSAPGRGTCVRVELLAVASTGPRPPTVPPPMAAIRERAVLVVDDEELVAKTVARMLGRDRTEVAYSARDALARAPLDRFDVIVCDLMMPGMTGIEFFDAVVGTQPQLASRFVFLTGGVFSDDARAFLEADGRRWLTKPASRRELTALVDEVAAAAA